MRVRSVAATPCLADPRLIAPGAAASPAVERWPGCADGAGGSSRPRLAAACRDLTAASASRWIASILRGFDPRLSRSPRGARFDRFRRGDRFRRWGGAISMAGGSVLPGTDSPARSTANSAGAAASCRAQRMTVRLRPMRSSQPDLLSPAPPGLPAVKHGTAAAAARMVACPSARTDHMRPWDRAVASDLWSMPNEHSDAPTAPRRLQMMTNGAPAASGLAAFRSPSVRSQPAQTTRCARSLERMVSFRAPRVPCPALALRRRRVLPGAQASQPPGAVARRRSAPREALPLRLSRQRAPKRLHTSSAVSRELHARCQPRCARDHR
jgi:hypothetical protein